MHLGSPTNPDQRITFALGGVRNALLLAMLPGCCGMRCTEFTRLVCFYNNLTSLFGRHFTDGDYFTASVINGDGQGRRS